MRKPARANRGKNKTYVPGTYPVPVMGLNAKDNIGAMDPSYALKMTNMFPEPDKVSVRRGYRPNTEGFDAIIETLMAWRGPSSVKLLASTDGQTYTDASEGTVVPVGTATTGGRWQYVNFTTAGGHYAVMVNGEDTPRTYDGSSLTTTTVTSTGLTSSSLINVVSHKSRLWFIQKDTMNAFYLPTSAISGALSKFPLGAVFKDGGSLIAAGSYSDDSGEGIDDFLAFISSTGELLLYSGTDPSSANTWALVGRFKTGVPLGRRCLANLGGDLLILTTQGVMSMKAILRYDRAQQELASVSNKIDPLIQADAELYGNNFGWQLIVYPKSKWLLVNVPAVEAERHYQYVMNTLTGAWCKFENLNSSCWEHVDDAIYFGGLKNEEGAVFLADYNYQDDSGQISANLKTAFNYMNSPGVQKHFGLIRPLITARGNPVFAIDGNVDFEDVNPSGVLSTPQIEETVWDQATPWDGDSTWAGTNRTLTAWTALNAVGTCLAINIKVQIRGGYCAINSFQITGQAGSTL
jgi:hypothetical protein